MRSHPDLIFFSRRLDTDAVNMKLEGSFQVEVFSKHTKHTQNWFKKFSRFHPFLVITSFPFSSPPFFLVGGGGGFWLTCPFASLNLPLCFKLFKSFHMRKALKINNVMRRLCILLGCSMKTKALCKYSLL